MSNLPQLPAEMLSAQIGNGFVLMGLGIGIVFLFLIILVFASKALSSLVRKFAPVETPKPIGRTASPALQSQDQEIAAAIVAAVAQTKK